nr:Phosphoglycerate transport regulatory protein pgtC precursor [Klebsiella pneumoniae]
MSSPSRSDTNHLMVESLLQQKAGLKDGKRC